MYSEARRRVLTLLAVACAGVGVWLLWPVLMHRAAQAIVASRAVVASKGAPDFTLKDAQGKRVSLSDFNGKVVVLNFWATWCGPCKTEIPWFIDFQKQWQGRGFTVLGVSMDEDGWKAINPYVAEKKINYPVVLANEEVNEAYGGIEALPTTLIIGRDGRVKFIHSGLIARAEYEKEIRELL
jgi:cytochrome c biogenesis protein CcmG/thiol:disulfide interchange protein DsbE